MKKEKGGVWPAVLAYSLSMLLMMAVTAAVLFVKIPRVRPTVSRTEETVTERYIYVYADQKAETEDETAERHVWIVKEHERRVGVFSEDGALLELLEVYTNTLPEADRRMLREGIIVTTRSDLYALLEDYTE